MTENYPSEFLRGIPNKSDQFITPEGYPTQAVFKFDDYDPLREDDYCELSINWLDDDGAISVLLEQINPRKNVIQFQGGYCRLSITTLHMLKDYFSNGHLSYERKPLNADEFNGPNKYHGNILMKDGLSKQTQTIIKSTLAGLAGSVIPRNET